MRGSIDGWDFKQYILGILFYRFISEHFCNYIKEGDPNIDYEKRSDESIPSDVIPEIVKELGYFIYPSALFQNVVANAANNQNLNTDLANIFREIENSALGFDSEQDIKGLFADFDSSSNRLGNTVADRNKRLTAVLKGINELDFGEFTDNQIDAFGDAYEFLISNYAANAGKSGGEFFTPQNVSKLIAQLATLDQDNIESIYDPACGSGSLLLQAQKQIKTNKDNINFFGQEINHTTYNLARMNMFLHKINYNNFDISLGDTLLNPDFKNKKPFDAIVSNPPYSVKWIGDNDVTLINDERYAPAGVLAPKGKADLAFIMHSLNYLSPKGRAAIVIFPGILYRKGAEQKIRQYLVDNNFVEAVISLQDNLFFGTSIAVNILVLAKNKTNNLTQFIDATEYYKKETNNNILTDEHIAEIIQLFQNKKDVEHLVKMVSNEEIGNNNYDLSVSSYVDARDTREKINIVELNQDINDTVGNITSLRDHINKIVSQVDK